MSEDIKPDAAVFDIRAVLAGRDYPEDVITFYIDEELGYKVSRVIENIEKLANTLRVVGSGNDKELIAKAEKSLNDAEELLERTKAEAEPYQATVRAISRGSRFDLQSKALHEFPIKRDILGNDDPENEFKRQKYSDLLIWASHLVQIQAPSGAVQTFNGISDLEVVKGVMDSLPESAYKMIYAGIDKLWDDGNRFEFAVQDEDF